MFMVGPTSTFGWDADRMAHAVDAVLGALGIDRYGVFGTDAASEQRGLAAFAETFITHMRRFRRHAEALLILDLKLADVTPPTRGVPLEPWHPTRLNARYQPALRLAEVVMKSSSFEPGADGLEIDGFVVDMAKVFEDFVCASLGVALRRRTGGTMKSSKRSVMSGSVSEARARGLVLMADHTYCYTPAVLKIRDLIASGETGEILYIDSVRINLGLIQPDVDVLWDLAPHDLSILDFILTDGLDMTEVSAVGSDPLDTGKACVGYLTLPLGSGGIAHVHVNWLSPTKIRRMVIAGTLRTIVWDDLNPQQRISVYDRGIDLESQSRTEANVTPATVSYRLGGMWAPALAEQEALANMATEFAAAIRGSRAARTSGGSGLRVLSVLEAAAQSLAKGGMPVAVEHGVPKVEEMV